MNAARPRCGKAYAQLPRELCVTTSHKGGSLLMAHLNKSDFLLVRAQGLHNSVDTVSRKAKYHFYAPVNQSFYEYISCRHTKPSITVGVIKNEFKGNAVHLPFVVV